MPQPAIPSPALLRYLFQCFLQRKPARHVSSSFHRPRSLRTARFFHECYRTRSRATNSSSISLTDRSGVVGPGEQILRTPESKHLRYRDGELIPRPLNRPLGLPYPPRPGQNREIDLRTWRQKKDEYANYESYLKRRRQIYLDIFENHYYRDVGNVGKVHKGKSILSPPTPFRSSVALYFPNLQGQTLASAPPWYASLFTPRSSMVMDTTNVLQGRISIVSLANTRYAGDQAKSFTSRAANPALHDLLDSLKDRERGTTRPKKLRERGQRPSSDDLELAPQFAFINIEPNPLKRALIRLSWKILRQQTPREDWCTYFLNRRGLTEEVRDAMAIWNSKVGYVYLLDSQCRIRWAGNGDARDNEKESLVVCVKRLVDEARGLRSAVHGAGRVEPQDLRVKRQTSK